MRALLLLPLLAAPASHQFWARLGNPEVKLPLAHPPELGLPLRPVAVVPVDGKARELAEALRAELAGGGAKLVDPSAVAWACAGENLAAPDAEALARLQRRLGEVHLLLASVSRAEIQQTRGDHSGKENGRPVIFQTADTALAFEGRLQVADLASGRLFPAQAFSFSPHASVESSQAPPAFPDPAPLRAQVLVAARAAASRQLLPWTETLSEICFNDNAYGMDKVHARLKAGDRDGAWDLAQQGAAAARADAKGEAKYRGRAVYDLGLVALLRGRPMEAAQLFQEALQLLPDASIFQDALKDAAKAQAAAEGMARWRSAAAEPPAPPAPADSAPGTPEARLKALKRLRDQGLITEKEFEAKKADILKGL
jgi:hypothetical protein